MRTLLFAALATLVIGIPSVLNAATGADVVPINWARFTSPASADSLSLKTKQVLQNAVKYFLNQYLDSCPTNASGQFVFSVDPGGESEIRMAAQGAGALGVLLVTGAYDSAKIGRSEQVARALQVKILKSISASHSGAGGWGNQWQSALWAAFAGFGAWLVWPDLDSATKTQTAVMVESETNRFNSEPPYCNDCTNDTKAEENSWNAQVMTTAIAMMPSHPNVNQWKNRASQWMLSAFARESDLNRNILVDGKLPRDWITGWNMREEGYVYNHAIMHPDYMCTITQNLQCLLSQSLAGQVVPQAGIYNFNVVYGCFVDYQFPAPPFVSPGGTIYRSGRSGVYYPNGTDWSPYRIDINFQADIFAYILPNVGNQVNIPASTWAAIRSDTLAWRQSRFTTGQQYAPGEYDRGGQSPWKFAESVGAWLSGTSYLALWLKAQNGFMPIGNWNWNLTTPDTIPPAAPSALVATALSPYSIILNWSHVTDVGSGTAYYLVYRDSSNIGITQDTFFLDQDVHQNTEYHYTVTALDWNNNESLKSTQAFVLTSNDTTALIIEKVTPANSREVMITFNKPVDSLTATDTANYSINGLSISGAGLNTYRNIVSLDVSAMTPNNSYTLFVSNIRDCSVPPHSITSGTRVSFTFSDLNDHLLGYWPMDEETGNKIYDMSGGNNNGVCQNSYSYSRIPGKIGNGLHFTPGGYVLMDANLGSLHFPFTIALWINREGADSARSLLATEDVGGQYFGTWMSISSSGQVQINFGNGGSPGPGSRKTKVSTSAVAKNIWTHVAAVVNSATDMTLYIDGVDAGGTYSGTATSMAHGVAGRMQFGYQTSAIDPILYYRGGMDDIRVYDTALTQEQIGRLAADTLTTGIAGKIAAHRPFFLDVAPNPFNPSVAITFSIPVAQKVVLDVFDVKGSRVARLVDGQKEAGEHKLIWAGSSQASGLYLLRMQAGTKILERKLVYLK